MKKSFTILVKEEIVDKTFQTCCLNHFLKTILYFNYQKHPNDNIINVALSSNKLATSLLSKYKKVFPDWNYKIINKKNNRYTAYIIQIKNKEQVLNNTIINNFSDYNKIANFHNHCLRSYVAAMFIFSGSINSPYTSYYHLEISFDNLDDQKYFNLLLKKYNFDFKSIKRNNKFISYIKKSNLISDFLKFIDASKAVLFFENIRIERDFVNNINRLNNIEVSNYQKILKASDAQIEMIKFLKITHNINNLDSKTKILCELRVSHKEANLLELAQLMGDKYGIVISKSGVNHLFRKLKKIYNQIIKDKNYE